jgi:anaerobic magnesium-protoporphyrin IX monomethyl ester cyclase
VLAPYRSRSADNVADELEELCDRYTRPYVIFRDPLFTQDRDRCEALCHEIMRRQLQLRFECETRLDRLDARLIDVLHAAGLRTVSFGVESVSAETLRHVGRRPTPEAHQRAIIEHCQRRGIVTAAFYVLGFLEDDRDSIAATIDYAVDLGSTFAQFKLLTPYPATPLWKKMAPLVTESDWEKFDGYTPVFAHPHLSGQELKLLLGSAYTRFYMRPSYLTNYLRLRNRRVIEVVGRLDRRVARRQDRELVELLAGAC